MRALFMECSLACCVRIKICKMRPGTTHVIEGACDLRVIFAGCDVISVRTWPTLISWHTPWVSKVPMNSRDLRVKLIRRLSAGLGMIVLST